MAVVTGVELTGDVAAEGDVTALVAVQQLEDAPPALAARRSRIQLPDAASGTVVGLVDLRAFGVAARPDAAHHAHEHMGAEGDAHGARILQRKRLEHGCHGRAPGVGTVTEECGLDGVQGRGPRLAAVQAGGCDRVGQLVLGQRCAQRRLATGVVGDGGERLELGSAQRRGRLLHRPRLARDDRERLTAHAEELLQVAAPGRRVEGRRRGHAAQLR